MRLRNKKTGEIVELEGYFSRANAPDFNIESYSSLKNINEEWEDAPEEPKEWWYIDIHGPHKVANNDEYYQQVKAASKEVGNYFETKEEAEKAVEKLKAFKRLKDKGFKFEVWDYDGYNEEVETGRILFRINKFSEEDKDLNLLFLGGEE